MESIEGLRFDDGITVEGVRYVPEAEASHLREEFEAATDAAKRYRHERILELGGEVRLRDRHMERVQESIEVAHAFVLTAMNAPEGESVFGLLVSAESALRSVKRSDRPAERQKPRSPSASA